MLTESDAFVWERPGPSEADHLGQDLRAHLKRALGEVQLPLRWVTLGLSVVVYTLPFLLFEEPLREALAANATQRAGLAIVILLGVSTLVLSPIFGLLAHARRESNALLEASRRYTATFLGKNPDGAVRLSISTQDGLVDVLVPHEGSFPARGEWVVYAIPEEASLGAVLVPGAPLGLRVGRLVQHDHLFG